MDEKEITQEKRKKIVLSLADSDIKTKGDLTKDIGIDRSNLDYHINKLNDLGVVHESGQGYSIVDRGVNIRQDTGKYISDIASFIPSALLILAGVIYCFVVDPSIFAPFAVGGILGFLSPFAYELYKFYTEDEYVRVFAKIKNPDSDYDMPNNWKS